MARVKLCRFRYGLFHKGYPWFFLLLILTDCTAIAAETVHHDLHVKLLPNDAGISVVDNIQLPANINSVDFSLRSDLTVKASGLELVLLGESDAGRLRHYRIKRLPGDGKVQLNYAGRKSHLYYRRPSRSHLKLTNSSKVVRLPKG